MRFFVFLALLLEAAATFLLLATQLTPFVALILHLISSSLMGYAVYLAMTETKNLVFFVSVVWTLAPPLGPICWLVFVEFLTRWKTGKDSSAVDEFLEAEDKLYDEMSAQILADRYSSLEEDEKKFQSAAVQPYVDIFSSDRHDLQRLAIMRLRQSQTPEAIHILKLAQTNTRYEVRYLATIALNLIEMDWTSNINKLVKECTEHPKEIKIRNELIYAYMGFYSSKLVSKRLSRIYLGKALEHAVLSLQVDAKQADILLQMAKINLFTGRYEHALKQINRVVDLEPSVEEFRFWKMEIEFYLKKYSSLKSTAELVSKKMEKYAKFKPLFSYWKETNAR